MFRLTKGLRIPRWTHFIKYEIEKGVIPTLKSSCILIPFRFLAWESLKLGTALQQNLHPQGQSLKNCLTKNLETSDTHSSAGDSPTEIIISFVLIFTPKKRTSMRWKWLDWPRSTKTGTSDALGYLLDRGPDIAVRVASWYFWGNFEWKRLWIHEELWLRIDRKILERLLEGKLLQQQENKPDGSTGFISGTTVMRSRAFQV